MSTKNLFASPTAKFANSDYKTKKSLDSDYNKNLFKRNSINNYDDLTSGK